MSSNRDPGPRPPRGSAAEQRPAPDAQGAGADRPAAARGVVHDKRGNATYDLGLSDTSMERLTGTGLLRQLDASGLSILEDPPPAPAKPAPAAGAPAPGRAPRAEGFNPYDRAPVAKKPGR
ncbi:MAG: hypothetical protein U1F11_05785 [Steroidobacteraceae bacterium]